MDLNKPIVPAPDGYTVDLQNPQRRGEAVITWVGIVGMTISTALLLIRVYTKIVLVKKMSPDDCELFYSCWDQSLRLTILEGCLILAWVSIR